MNLADDDLDMMLANGRRIKGYEKPAPKENEELKALQMICHKLDQLVAKPVEPLVILPPEQKAPVVNVPAPVVKAPVIPTPVVNVPAPVVNVPAPVVNVPPAPARITRWKFKITERDKDGRAAEIIAEAL